MIKIRIPEGYMGLEPTSDWINYKSDVRRFNVATVASFYTKDDKFVSFLEFSGSDAGDLQVWGSVIAPIERNLPAPAITEKLPFSKNGILQYLNSIAKFPLKGVVVIDVDTDDNGKINPEILKGNGR